MRFVGERKACAAAVLAFFATLFLLNGLAGIPAFAPMFLALAASYLIGFFGLVAGWFWARWFAMGLGFSGLILGALLGFQVGFDEPVVWIWGGSHGVVVLTLLGQALASAFDGRKDWREKYKMDDNAANRLGKSIINAGASLPYLILAGLAPKQGMAAALGFAALAAGVLGLRALVKLRTWGVLALVAAAALVVGARGAGWSMMASGADWSTAIAAVLLCAAVVPFVGPIARRLRVG
jgi:hypothetical protein